MKTLLNNPWVVGALSMFALVVLSVNVIVPWLSEPQPGQVTGPPPQSLGLVPPLLEPHSGSVARPGQGWPSRILRDPFGSAGGVALSVRRRQSDTPARPQRDERKAETVPLRLRAVAVDAELRWAVVNRTVVAEGDYLGEFRVSEIEPGGVVLTGPRGTRRLKFTVNP